jgi:hypothetical protein
MQHSPFSEANGFTARQNPTFMEPEGSLPHSQQPTHLSLSRARSIQSSTPPPQSYFLKIHFSIIVPPTLTFPH